ncbi:hypothetical protein JW905_15235 [bacterium]|nr:hypothetical protein [candidate division CSSED10-310 bacterium]
MYILKRFLSTIQAAFPGSPAFEVPVAATVAVPFEACSIAYRESVAPPADVIVFTGWRRSVTAVSSATIHTKAGGAPTWLQVQWR